MSNVKIYSIFDCPVSKAPAFSKDDLKPVVDTEARWYHPSELLQKYASGHPLSDLVRPVQYLDTTRQGFANYQTVLANFRNDYSLADKNIYPTLESFIDAFKPSPVPSPEPSPAPSPAPSPEPSPESSPVPKTSPEPAPK